MWVNCVQYLNSHVDIYCDLQYLYHLAGLKVCLCDTCMFFAWVWVLRVVVVRDLVILRDQRFYSPLKRSRPVRNTARIDKVGK